MKEKIKKKKFITLRRYQEIIEPGERLSYSDKSPFDSITLPSHEGVFIAWHGPQALIFNGGTGTAYACRVDAKDPKPLNFDVYSISPTKNPEIIEIIISPKQKYHWADDVPNIMKESVPGWIKERVAEIKKHLRNKNMKSENKKKAVVEHEKEICRKCGHTRDEHCGAKHIFKNPNYLYKSCSKCDCKSFEPRG